jgi:hypothetical protein
MKLSRSTPLLISQYFGQLKRYWWWLVNMLLIQMNCLIIWILSLIKIKTGDDLVPNAKEYRNPEYVLTSNDRLKSGGFQELF